MAGNFSSRMKQMRVEADIENRRQDNTSRSKIAYIFTWGFIVLIAVILVGGPLYNATIGQESPVDVNQVMSSFVGQFGAPLGFVLGYYFKDKNSTEA